MPVKSQRAGDHHMHSEWIEVGREAITQLLERGRSPVVAGGTTALRTLESLYWVGAKIAASPGIAAEALAVTQWEPYDAPSAISTDEALAALQAPFFTGPMEISYVDGTAHFLHREKPNDVSKLIVDWLAG